MTWFWRPFEQCKENLEKAATDTEENRKLRMESVMVKSCKFHKDCRAADEMVRAAGGRVIKVGNIEVITMHAKHGTEGCSTL